MDCQPQAQPFESFSCNIEKAGRTWGLDSDYAGAVVIKLLGQDKPVPFSSSEL